MINNWKRNETKRVNFPYSYPPLNSTFKTKKRTVNARMYVRELRNWLKLKAIRKKKIRARRYRSLSLYFLYFLSRSMYHFRRKLFRLDLSTWFRHSRLSFSTSRRVVVAPRMVLVRLPRRRSKYRSSRCTRAWKRSLNVFRSGGFVHKFIENELSR